MHYKTALAILKDAVAYAETDNNPYFFDVSKWLLKKYLFGDNHPDVLYRKHKQVNPTLSRYTFTVILSSRLGKYAMFGYRLSWEGYDFWEFMENEELQEQEFERFVLSRFTEDDVVKIVESLMKGKRTREFSKFVQEYYELHRSPLSYHIERLFDGFRKAQKDLTNPKNGLYLKT